MSPIVPRTLVTGAGVRLGASLARGLAARGCPVVLHANRHVEQAERVAAEIRETGGQADVVASDLSAPGAATLLARQVLSRFGPLGGLVLSASVYQRIPLEDVTESDLDAAWRVNLASPFLLAREIGVAMRTTGGGSILALLDWSVERPRPDYLPYEISKAGLAAATRGLARALAPEVRVNGLGLGAVLLPEGTPEETRAAVLRATPRGRMGTPEDLVATAIHLLLDADFATGAIWTLDGGRSLR